MIKEIKTEKFSGLAMLVPDDATKFSLKKTKKGKPDQLHYFIPYTCDAVSNQRLVILPSEDYLFVGKATELTEEQCAEITPNSFYGRFIDYNMLEVNCGTAKESFASLMQSLQCYSVNPLSDPEGTMRQGDGYVYYSASDEEFEEYEKAQANTGTWLILKKL